MKAYNRNTVKSYFMEEVNDFLTIDDEIIETEECFDTLNSFRNYYVHDYEAGWNQDSCFVKGDDGFYYELDYNTGECYSRPYSRALASKLAGFFDKSWGTQISPMMIYRGIRYVKSFIESERIQRQYEAAISRTSDYRGRLYSHVNSRNGLVYEPVKDNYLVGYEANGYFIVSHFAPKTITSGVKMMKRLAESEDMPLVIATLEYQANQLIRMGWKVAGHVPQFFNGEIHIKTVCVNKAVNLEGVSDLLLQISE